MAWEITRTPKIKLNVPDDRKSDFHATNAQFQYCANRTSDWAWRYPDDFCITNYRTAHDALYTELKHESGLHANLVQQAIRRAIKAVDNGIDLLKDGQNTSQPRFTSFSIAYDQRCATFRRDSVSLSTVNGRVECDYVLPDDIEGTPYEYLFDDRYSFSDSTVHYDSEEDAFYLHAVLEREFDDAGPEKAEDSKVLGVDCNVDDHIAVTSTAQFVGNADHVNHRRREYEKTRGGIQQTGTRAAHRTMRRVGGRFARWSRHKLHRVANVVVEEARQHDCTHIAVERLTHILDRISNGAKFQQWAFRKLQELLEEKAAEHAIKLVEVNPQYTSQQCSKCGFTHENNRDRQAFACLQCGYDQNADYNAGKNIARKLAQRLRTGQMSPTGGASSQYALHSGAMIVTDTQVSTDTPLRPGGASG